MSINSEIMGVEEELRLAMLNNDVTKLDGLINDSLVFVGPDGSIASKQMDLESHRNKIQKMSELNPSEYNIQEQENSAIVTLKMEIKGTYGDWDISGFYRYLRIWQNINNKWQIVAGSVTKLNS